jgi:hypothetical protein
VKAHAAILVLLAAPASAQVSPRPPDAVVPVVGSTEGQANAHFKTELQLSNPAGNVAAGFLVLRPQGIALRYELAPHATLAFEDVVAEIGATGLASLDVLVDRGSLPVVVARAYDDQPGGTTGLSVPLIPAASILGRNDSGALIAPRDLARFRFNIGVRSLDIGATLELTIYDAAGTQRQARDVTYEANAFEQLPGDLFAGVALQANDSIHVRIAAGSAIVYATTVDNATNDSSLQVLRR